MSKFIRGFDAVEMNMNSLIGVHKSQQVGFVNEFGDKLFTVYTGTEPNNSEDHKIAVVMDCEAGDIVPNIGMSVCDGVYNEGEVLRNTWSTISDFVDDINNEAFDFPKIEHCLVFRTRKELFRWLSV